MTVGIDEEAAGHNVMVLFPYWGDVTIDNKHNGVLPRVRTGDVYVKRKGDEGSMSTSQRPDVPKATLQVSCLAMLAEIYTTCST